MQLCKRIMISNKPEKLEIQRRVLPENMDMKETWFSVLGKDITIPINMVMIEKMTVHIE
jgi:hypothetical protein